MKDVIDERIQQLNSKSESATKKLYQLTKSIGNIELSSTLLDVLDKLSAPFTFVIVGEVKAGKSSFVNALIESETDICAVAPSPMTDTIQLITYGEETTVEDVNPHFKRITHKVDILRDIAIVDTPGTNTIVAHHQEITERFIPHSDLIVFVFEAKNPYRQSAWEFFDFINEDWRRKIIFVLQQKDLMEPQDLEINIQGVVTQAEKKGIEDPKVFAVSAKMEKDGYTAQSGFIALKRYIADHITNGSAPFLKIANNTNTALTINERIESSIKLREEQWQYDQSFRNEIKEILDNQERKTQKQIDVLTENLLAAYDRITNEKIQKLEEGLGFVTVLKRSLGSVFGSQESLKDWLSQEAKDFEYKLNTSLKERLNNGIIEVADNIQTMGKLVHGRIKDSKTILSDSDEIFADIAEKRANVLMELQRSFGDFLNNSENFYDEHLSSKSGQIAPNLAAGSGIAVIGVLLTTFLQGAVFDITGGILTTVGLLFAGVSLGLNKRKIISGFRKELNRGREQLSWEVTDKLKDYTMRIKNRIDDNFYQLDLLLNHEEKVLEELNLQKNTIKMELEEVKNRVNDIIKSIN